MAFQLGSVVAKITTDLTGFQSGLNKAQSSMKGFSNRMTDSLTSIRKTSLLVTGAIAGVGAISLKFGETAGKYESIKDAFGSMTKSMNINVEDFEKTVAKASAGTLDRLTILQGGTRALSLIGGEAFTDFGAQFAKMAELSKKSARATGQDVTYMFDSLITGMSRESKMILDNLGITVDLTQAKSDFAQELGKSVDALTVSESKTAVLNHTLEKLEDTYGEVAVSSGGFSGAMQKLKAQLTDAKIEIGTELLPVLNEIVRSLIPIVKDLLPKFIKGMKGLIDWVIKLPSIGKKFLVFLTLLAPLLVVITTVMLGLLKLGPMLITALGALKTAFLFLVSPVGLVVLAITALIAIGILIAKNWDKITGAFVKFKDAIVSLKEPVMNILKAIGGAFKWLWEVAIKPIFESIATGFMFFANIFKWVWENILSPILMLIGAIFANVFLRVFEAVKTHMENVWNAIKRVLTDIWEIVKPFLDMMLAFVMRIWEAISSVTLALWNQIKTHMITPFMEGVNLIMEFINRIWTDIKNTWEKIWGFLKSIGGRIFDALMDPWRRAKSAIEETARKIKEVAEQINPFHRDSPSLVDNVEAGMEAIRRAYAGVGLAVGGPRVAGVGVGNGGTVISISMAGANIASPDIAEDFAEKIGDQIISKLKSNIRI